MNRFAWIFLVLFACTTPTMVRKTARLYEAKYYPPYTTTMVLMAGKAPIIMPVYHPERCVVWFDVGEEYGMPAYVSCSMYQTLQLDADYDITYSNGEGCGNIRHVTQFN